jgi:membrane-bound inhibitor of C-type lysozyme
MNAKVAAAVLISALALAACSDNGPAATQELSQADGQPQIMDGHGDPITLTCPGGLSVSFRFLGPETIELLVAKQTFRLHQQRSASGARYVGEGAELWNKGSESMLLIGEQHYQCRAEVADG